MSVIAHNYKYWMMNVFHNTIIHPFMPLADLFLLLNWRRMADFIYHIHEITTPHRLLR